MSERKDGNKNPKSDDDSSRKRKHTSTEKPKKNIKSFFTSIGKLFVDVFYSKDLWKVKYKK